jgi:hypothetical protein
MKDAAPLAWNFRHTSTVRLLKLRMIPGGRTTLMPWPTFDENLAQDCLDWAVDVVADLVPPGYAVLSVVSLT